MHTPSPTPTSQKKKKKKILTYQPYSQTQGWVANNFLSPAQFV